MWKIYVNVTFEFLAVEEKLDKAIQDCRSPSNGN